MLDSRTGARSSSTDPLTENVRDSAGVVSDSSGRIEYLCQLSLPEADGTIIRFAASLLRRQISS
jgi:hypothetical protein